MQRSALGEIFKNKITIISESVCLFELAQVLGAGELGTLDSGPDTLVPQPQHADHGDSKEIRFKVFQLFLSGYLFVLLI